MRVKLKNKEEFEVELSPEFYDEDYYMRGIQSGKSSYKGGWAPRSSVRERTSILNYFGNIKNIVEVGCAFGNIVMAFEDIGVEVLGVEYSNFCVENSYAKNVIWGDLPKGLPIKDGEYELVLCLEVLEHIEDTESAIRELCRISNKWIFVTIPENTEARLKDEDASHISMHPKHLWVEKFRNNNFILQAGNPTGFINYKDGMAMVFQKLK